MTIESIADFKLSSELFGGGNFKSSTASDGFRASSGGGKKPEARTCQWSRRPGRRQPGLGARRPLRDLGPGHGVRGNCVSRRINASSELAREGPAGPLGDSVKLAAAEPGQAYAGGPAGWHKA